MEKIGKIIINQQQKKNIIEENINEESDSDSLCSTVNSSEENFENSEEMVLDNSENYIKNRSKSIQINFILTNLN